MIALFKVSKTLTSAERLKESQANQSPNKNNANAEDKKDFDLKAKQLD
jgi:hypothetical protein